MTPLPLTLCLYTSTKGHYGVFNRYQQTVTDLFNQVPASTFSMPMVHIKVSETPKPGEPSFKEMNQWLWERKVIPTATFADWSHGESHQREYLKDMTKLTRDAGEFVLHLEDDFLLRAHQNDLIHYLCRAIVILTDPDIVQVRIPRWANERERILGLRAKHGIDGRAVDGKNPDHFLTNDWSNNVFVARARDMQTALLLIERNPQSFPQHAEHGLGAAMKYLSRSATPLAVFDPSHVSAYHIGTLPGEEDPLDKPLLAT